MNHSNFKSRYQPNSFLRKFQFLKLTSRWYQKSATGLQSAKCPIENTKEVRIRLMHWTSSWTTTKWSKQHHNGLKTASDENCKIQASKWPQNGLGQPMRGHDSLKEHWSSKTHFKPQFPASKTIEAQNGLWRHHRLKPRPLNAFQTITASIGLKTDWTHPGGLYHIKPTASRQPLM